MTPELPVIFPMNSSQLFVVTLLILANPIEIRVFLHSHLHYLLKLFERATRARSTLTQWQWSRCSIGNETHVFGLLCTAVCLTGYIADHLFHTDMTEERYQIRHLPRTSEVDMRGREFIVAAASGGVEDTQGGGDDWRDLTVSKGEEKTLVMWPAGCVIRVWVFVLLDLGIVFVVFVDLGEEFGL